MQCPVGVEVTDGSVENVEYELLDQRMQDAGERVVEVELDNDLEQVIPLDFVPQLQIADSDQVVDDLFEISYFIFNQFTSTSLSRRTLSCFCSCDRLRERMPNFSRNALMKSDSSNLVLNCKW